MINNKAKDLLPIIKSFPEFHKTEPNGAVDVCGECGMRIKPVMGYSCPKNNCPVFRKAIC